MTEDPQQPQDPASGALDSDAEDQSEFDDDLGDAGASKGPGFTNPLPNL